jgi:hypothetical protein
VRRIACLLALVPLVAACGSTTHATGSTSTGTISVHVTTTTSTPSPTVAAGGGRTLYLGGDWAVVSRGHTAVALHLVGSRWKPDRTRRVEVVFLGPAAVTTTIPQIAAELTAKTPLVESGLWVDGVEIDVKGGGTETSGTIYGAPASKLQPGVHIAVAYARTATAATAVARVFRVR